MLMLRSEVRADGQTLEPQGVGERAELVGDGARERPGCGESDLHSIIWMVRVGWAMEVLQ